MTTVATLARFRTLIEGGDATASYPITAGRFNPTAGRESLSGVPESYFSCRPYEVLPLSEGQPTSGPANLSGDLVGSSVIVAVRVGYLEGGGGDSGDLPSVADLMAYDASIIRRVLECPENYSPTTTGIEETAWTGTKFNYAQMPDRRAYLELTFVVDLVSDYSTF